MTVAHVRDRIQISVNKQCSVRINFPKYEVPQSSAKFYSHELFERIHDRHVSLEGEDQRGVQGANLQHQIYIELIIGIGYVILYYKMDG